jgi:hypothetical protein
MVTIRLYAPQPGAVLNPGDALTVAGVATGSPGAEPVSIETVTVALAGPPIEAVLTFVPHQPAPTVRFEATLTVPAVAGDQQLQAVAFADDLKRANVWVPVIIQAPQPPPPWATSPLAPAGALPGAARLTAIAKPAGCELWWLGADGAVNGRWTEPGPEWVSNQLEWASYQLAGAGGAAPGGGITAVSKGGDVMEVWWIGPDGSVQAAYHDSDWHLYTLAGPGSAAVTGGIAGIFKGGDVMEVWWVGPDGSVQAAYHEGGWQAYTLAGSGAAATTGAITAVFKGGDFMEVWWVGPDGSVTGAYHEADWQTYTLAGPGSASRTCRITSAFGGSLVANVMRVWWVDAGGTPYQAFFDGAWSVSPIGTGATPSGAAVGVLFNPDTPTGFWAGTDGSLVDAYPPEITLPAHVSGGHGLHGTVWLTLRQDGSTRWHGDITNDEFYGYNFGLSAFGQTGTSADIGAAHDGHVAGWGEPGGSSNDIWDEEHHPNPALADKLAKYRFSGLSVEHQLSVDLVHYLEAAIDAIFEVAAASVLGDGVLVMIGVEIVSSLLTGSPVPGAIIAGGVPWLAGPAGIFLRVLVTASGSDGRQLTDQEYAWANDMVFRGSLPPIHTFQITNYIGIGNLPFTFPTLGGLTLVSLGDALFNDLHSDDPTVIHELTHVCQIAHTQDLVFTTTAIATQLKDRLTDAHVYDYGAAGFDFTDLGIEAQAAVVEDWFRGCPPPDRPMNPDPRNHTKIPMDAQSPYYRYITDNLRTGHFT